MLLKVKPYQKNKMRGRPKPSFSYLCYTPLSFQTITAGSLGAFIFPPSPANLGFLLVVQAYVIVSLTLLIHQVKHAESNIREHHCLTKRHPVSSRTL